MTTTCWRGSRSAFPLDGHSHCFTAPFVFLTHCASHLLTDSPAPRSTPSPSPCSRPPPLPRPRNNLQHLPTRFAVSHTHASLSSVMLGRRRGLPPPSLSAPCRPPSTRACSCAGGHKAKGRHHGVKMLHWELARVHLNVRRVGGVGGRVDAPSAGGRRRQSARPRHAPTARASPPHPHPSIQPTLALSPAPRHTVAIWNDPSIVPPPPPSISVPL